jgi:hypothetical protein
MTATNLRRPAVAVHYRKAQHAVVTGVRISASQHSNLVRLRRGTISAHCIRIALRKSMRSQCNLLTRTRPPMPA